MLNPGDFGAEDDELNEGDGDDAEEEFEGAIPGLTIFRELCRGGHGLLT